jgi:hypothetical protein
MNYNSDNNLYNFERLSASNISDLYKLYTAVYHHQRTPGYFETKYDTAYTGVQYTGFIAYNNRNEAVAYYGVIPCFIKYEGKLIRAAQSTDTMTHPEYRHEGLFMQLARLTFKLCTQEGIKIIFGFANQNAVEGLEHLDWETNENMELYLIPVETIPLENLAEHTPLLGRLYKEYQHRVLKKYLVPQKGIENSVLNDGFAGVNRDELYLNHKDCHDTQVLRIGKALLWVKIKSNAFIIGDIICADKDFDNIMQKVHKLASLLGLNQVQFQTSPNTKASGLFSKRYHFIPSFPIMFKTFVRSINPDKIKFTFADIDAF